MTLSTQDIYGDGAHYVPEDSAAAIEGLPDGSWDALVKACDVILGGGDEPGIDCAVTKTHETIADFDTSRLRYWSKRGARTEHVVMGRPAVHYDRYQFQRGQERGEMVVIDLGDCRAVLAVG